MTLVYVCVGARVWQCGTKVCGGERVCVWVGAGVYYVFVGVILTYVLREGGGLKGVPMPVAISQRNAFIRLRIYQEAVVNIVLCA